MPIIKKAQLIEIVFQGIAGGNTATKIQIPDQPYLRGVATWGIETFTSVDITTSPAGNVPMTLAQMKNAFLTLYMNDIESPNDIGEWIQTVPLSRLHNLQNASNETFSRMPFAMAGQKIYWEKCYITLSAQYANTANVAFLFLINFSGKTVS